MKRFRLLALDVSLILLATLSAQILRDNFDLDQSLVTLAALSPYLIATVAISILVIPALRLHRSVWRFSSMHDYLMLALASGVIVLGATLLTFGYNRLEGTARSIPVLQFLTILVFLVGARVFSRIRHASRGGAR